MEVLNLLKLRIYFE